MKKIKRLIAGVSAFAMLIASFASVSAITNIDGLEYTSCFNAYGDASSNKNTYVITSGTTTNTFYYGDRTSARCVISTLGSSQVEIRQHVLSTSGERAMTIRPADTGSMDSNHAGSALVRFIFPTKVVDNEYHIRFNAMIDDLVWDYKNYAYATMNWHQINEGSSGKAGLLYSRDNADGLWTVTSIGTGEENGGYREHQWYRYETTIVATNDENELRFSAKGWDTFHIDDILITDKFGNVVFSEDFEYTTPESDVTTRWTYDGTAGAVDYRLISDLQTGSTNHKLRVKAKDSGLAKLYIDVPKVTDNTYTLSYEKSGEVISSVAVGMVDGVWGDMNIGSGTGTVTKTFNSGGNTRLRIVAEGWGLVDLDNICLKDKNGNIVFYENFESYEEEFETSDVGVNSDYAPQNLIATQRAEHIMLSWINPVSADLSKVSLYEITASGTETLLKDDFSTTAKAYLNYDITGLTAASEHTYKVVCEFGETTVTESIISGIASEIRDSNILGVRLNGNHPGTSLLEHSDTHSGTGAVRVISNLSSWTSNNYIVAQTPTISFSSSKAYEISLWMKGKFAGSDPIQNYKDAIKDGNPSTFKYDGATTTFNAGEADANGWRNITFRINGKGATPISFMGENKTNMLIDDIEVWELDSNGDRTENMIYSENFNSQTANVASVSHTSTKVTSGAAKIIFKAPTSAEKVRVYAKNSDGALSKRAEVLKSTTSVIFKNLQNDNEYTYVIKAVDGYNNESAGVEVTATPTSEVNPDFYGSDITTFEGEDEIVSYKDGWEQEGDTKRQFSISEKDGNHRLRIYGKDGNQGSGHIGTYKISLPKRSSSGEYHITYDIELQEGKTKTSASLDVTGTSIYSSGHQLTNDGGEHVVTGSGNYLIFAAEGWANAYVDNIVVKDANDNVLFTEDFENFDEKYTYYEYSTRLGGLSANGIGDAIYLSWRNPKRDDIASIKIYENGEETIESQIYDITLLSNEVNIIEMSDNFIGAGTIHEYDVQMVTESGMLYHNYITAAEGERFLSKTKTKDGNSLQGWSLSASDGESVNGLGSVYYDTLNKAEGNASLHINPNITRISSEQEYSTNKTHVIVTYADGEQRANFYLEALIYGLTETGTYKLSFKQKGHYAPAYHVYYVGSSTKSIGAFTGQNGYTNYAAWQEKELEFTVDNIPSSGMPAIRFDFSNGCDDFWLDDVKLIKVGGDGTNYIANGSFEYGISNLAKSGNNITWTLADSNDSVNVYKKAGDTLIKIATLAKGSVSYAIPELEGTKQTLVFRTVKKSGTNEFQSEGYPIEITQDSYVYDAKFEYVDENLEVIGASDKLTGGAFLKASVRIENASSELVGADLYSMIYKNGILLNVDKQLVSTDTGEIGVSSIIKVPDISDGNYSAKVFVWNMGDFKPVKEAKALDE